MGDRMCRRPQLTQGNLWSGGEGALDIGHCVFGDGEAELQAAVADRGGNGWVAGGDLSTDGVQFPDLHLPRLDPRDEQLRGFEPVNPRRAPVRVRGNVPGRSPASGYQVDIAAGGALVAHQASDEGDLFSIGR